MLSIINMSISTAAPGIRDCARDIIDAIGRCGDDYDALARELREPVAALCRHDDLPAVGAPRQGNNVANSSYLYFDGELSILLFEVPAEKPVPPHDHGIWEAFCVYRGKVRHETLRRIDDASVDGYAELGTVREDVLGPGDLLIIAPPADIHSFVALEEATLGLTIANGPYKHERLYYQPEHNSYVVRPQVNFR